MVVKDRIVYRIIPFEAEVKGIVAGIGDLVIQIKKLSK